jgi:parallel beta-helix repeat protein
MIHRKVLFLLLPVICLSLLGFVRFGAKASPTIIRVPQDYTTIQEAINHANPGDTVNVSAGTYYENLFIDKNLTLTGENRENTILNAMGGCGIEVNSTSVTITEFTIVNATNGIYIEESNRCIVSHNNVTGSHGNITDYERGIYLYHTNNSIVTDNAVSDVGYRGIVLCGHSSENTITLNTVRDCGNGIVLSGEGDFIFHNNFVNNQNQTGFLDSFYNAWNDTYEGNYWSDYNGTDADHDGIGDTPYLMDGNNQDNHPLMGMFYQFEIITQEQTDVVTMICNSTITDFAFGTPYAGAINFNTTGPEGTGSFCRIVIPNTLFDHNYTILVDGSPPLEQNELPLSNSTHTYLYFTFANTTHSIVIIPEFATMFLLLIIVLSIPTVMAVRKRRLKKRAK